MGDGHFTREPDFRPTYFLKKKGEGDFWRRVSKTDFIRAERCAGFYPKGGDESLAVLATNGFVGKDVEGEILHPIYKSNLKCVV